MSLFVLDKWVEHMQIFVGGSLRDVPVYGDLCRQFVQQVGAQIININESAPLIPKTLRCTPAQEAGLSDHAWTYEDVAKQVDCLPKFLPKKRGPYNKRKSD